MTKEAFTGRRVTIIRNFQQCEPQAAFELKGQSAAPFPGVALFQPGTETNPLNSLPPLALWRGYAHRMRLQFWSVFLLCVCRSTSSASLSLSTTPQSSLPSRGTTPFPAATPAEDDSAQLVDWLSKYGYLQSSDDSTGQLQTWSAVSQAVKAMQRFAGLEETGVADEETLQLMQTPRCSLPDEDKASNQLSSMLTKAHGRRLKRAVTSWRRRNINWRLSSYPSSSTLSREMVRSLVFYALRVWAEPTTLEFHEVGGPEVADLQVDFLHGPHGDGYPFDGTGGAVGHAFYPSDPDRAGGVHLDAEEDWVFRQPATEGTDLFTVLIHELGHALGLSHSSARRSVMRPYYQGPLGDPLQFRLGPPDLEQITALYGRRTNDLPPESASEAREPLLRHRNQPSTLGHTHHHNHHHHRHSHGHLHSHGHAIDRCNTTFDAVAKIRGEIFFFKGLNMWRVSRVGLVTGRAVSVRRLWGALPSTITSVRAVLERRSDHAIIFITDSQVWLFKELSLQEGYPQPLSNLTSSGSLRDRHGGDQGLLWSPKEGAVWGFISEENEQGTEEEEGDRNEDQEVEDCDIWKELIHEGVNGIIADDDGSTYLFKGNSYWKFAYPGSAPDDSYPRSLAIDWLDCPDPSSQDQGDLSLTLPGVNQEFRGRQEQHRDNTIVVKNEVTGEEGNQIKHRTDRHRYTSSRQSDREMAKEGPLYWTCPCMNNAPGCAVVQLTILILIWPALAILQSVA